MKIDNRTAEVRVADAWCMAIVRDRFVTLAEAEVGVMARIAAHAWVNENFGYFAYSPTMIARLYGYCLLD